MRSSNTMSAWLRPKSAARLRASLFDTFTATAGMFDGIDADKPVNGAVRVDAAPTLLAHDGRGMLTGWGLGAAVPVLTVPVDVEPASAAEAVSCDGTSDSGSCHPVMPSTDANATVVVVGDSVVVVVVLDVDGATDVVVEVGASVASSLSSVSISESSPTSIAATSVAAVALMSAGDLMYHRSEVLPPVR